MATCKDCLHLSVCDYDANKYNFRLPENADKCTLFKDRSKFVEMPCKVGDAIYIIYSDEDGSLIEELTVSEVSTQRIRADYGCSFHYDDLGKTVFLTREKAEKALEEREQE